MMGEDQVVTGHFPVGYYPLHPNISLNFQMNRFWGWVGEPQMLEELRSAGGRIATYDDWAREMLALRDKAKAEQRRLAAAYYAKAAIFFLDPSDPRFKPNFQLFLTTVLKENGVAPDEHHAVPYQNTSLSAYRFTPAHPRGTLVIFGGYDSYIVEWLPAAMALRDAGLDTIVFDGPGQGTVLDAGVPMTPDWHLPTAAILDYFKLSDITLLGFSLGGCLVLRAAAREPRVKRAVAFDVCTDLFEATTRGFGSSGLAAIAANADDIPATVINAAVTAVGQSDLLTDWVFAQGKRVMGVSTPADVFKAWKQYRTNDVSPLVTQDVLLMAGTKDHYMPLQMLPDQLMMLTAAHSVSARMFTEAESAQNHCQTGNTGLAIEVILDWLDQTGGRTARPDGRREEKA